ncbi:MAG: hypothetical protein V1495_02180 [Pseudomonadota bacterium]
MKLRRALILAVLTISPGSWAGNAVGPKGESVAGQTYYAQGEDLVEQFTRFLFPISGRERRTMFLPDPDWGEKKPQYERFRWRKFESDHFDFLVYPKGESTLPDLTRYFEEEWVRNNRIFGVDARFTKKVPVIFYQTRQEFEQTNVIGGPVPEALGGLTELFAWKRVTFPFEGERQKFEHVAKHEGTHVYQIAKGVRRLPLWFVEGSAETNSIYWDADAEMAIRDAYVNGFFYRTDDLWQIEGTWLMYKEGNFISNVLWDEFGEPGFRKIFDRARSDSFEENLKSSLGWTPEKLDEKVSAALSTRYSDLLTRKDLAETAQRLAETEVLLHARGPFFLSGGLSGPRNALYVNFTALDGSVVRKKIVADREFRNESLDYFRKGGSLDDRQIVYSIKRSGRDELRIVPYTFTLKNRKFSLGKTEKHSWPGIDSIVDPVPAGPSRIAFIGYAGGYSDLYLFDRGSGRLDRLTDRREHLSGLDFSDAAKSLVYSKEEERAPNRLRYNRNLYLFHLDTRQAERLTDTRSVREEEPRFSSDGKRILYVADPDGTYDLMILDLDRRESRRLTRMKIGAKRPQFGDGNFLLFVSPMKLAPSIFRVPMPSAVDQLQASWPVGKPERLLLTEGRLAPAPAPTEKPNASPATGTGLFFTDRKAKLAEQEEVYGVDGFAVLPKGFLFRGRAGDPDLKKARADSKAHYWEWDGTALTSLESKMVDRRWIPPSLMSRITPLLDGRPVVDGWVSTDGRNCLLLVNNRLAREAERFDRKPETGIVVFDVESGKIEELPEGPGRDLSTPIQWVAFLADHRILLAVSEEPNGPFVLLIYDRTKRTFDDVSRDADGFRISPDRRRVVWASRRALFGYENGHDFSLHGLETNGVLAFDFLRDGRLLLFAGGRRNWWAQTISPANVLESKILIPHETDLEAVFGAVDPESGSIVIRGRPKKRPRVPEKLLLWNPKNAALNPVVEGGVSYPFLAFRGKYLNYTETVAGSKEVLEWAVQDGIKYPIHRMVTGEKMKGGSILLRGEEPLVLWNQKSGTTTTLATENAGYAAAEGELIYSAPSGPNFELFSYALASGRTRKLTESTGNAVEPEVVGGRLVWVTGDRNGWELRDAPLSDPKQANRVTLAGYDLVSPKMEGTAVAIEAVEKPKEKIPSRPPEEPYQPRTLSAKPAPEAFHVRSLVAAVGYDGESARFLVSGFADNLFSDRGIFVDAVFLGGSRFGTAGYADLRHGMSYAGFYNFRDEIRDYGTEISKTFTLDRYREIRLYGDLEIQEYGLPTVDTASFVTPDVQNRTFHLLKGGAVFAYDETVWDRHGPIAGSRLFFKAETGGDPGKPTFGNVDANVDFRWYNRFLPRFGLAHRVSAGTSQGNLPSVFLVGGNLSFRGVGFDELIGQNYWVVSEDLRLPIFDFLGGKFFDPLDQAIGFLIRYFDIRGGIYADVGSVWYNGTHPKVVHSVGYFVNAPTFLGLNFRLSQGFLGRKRIGIWLGYNW